jgi:hypothetical protein
MNTYKTLTAIVVVVLLLCLVLMFLNNTKKTTFIDIPTEHFTDSTTSSDSILDAISEKLSSESPDQLKSTISTLQKKLIDYGYTPQLDSYVKKTELTGDTGQCTVNKAVDRDKYMSKTDLPLPGPRIDLSQYVKKSSIPPEKVCPTPPEVDWSKYVLKSSLPPNQECPPCIAPKVKVSAGLCRECPPAPSCPAPQPCPSLKCPEPAPCVQKECPKCDEIRYIKVPAVITKTIRIGLNGQVISEELNSGDITAEQASTIVNNVNIRNTNEARNNSVVNKRLKNDEINRQIANERNNLPTITPTTTTPNNTDSCILNEDIPSTSFPATVLYPSADLNSVFKRTGIYGPEQDLEFMKY